MKVLFFATILLGIGSLLANPSFHLVEADVPSVTSLISNLLRYGGAFIIKLFPLMVFIKVLGKHFEDSAPLIIGLFSYTIILVIVMILEQSDFPSYFYQSVLGIELESNFVNNVPMSVQNPYQMGIFPLLCAYYITKFSYIRSRHHVRHGIFYFIDHDMWAVLISFTLSILVGLLFVVVWPYVIMLMRAIFDYIASDINNPLHMFFYGVVDRLSAITNMQDVPRSVFWLSEAGGSYIDSLGNSYFGDVNIWMATKDMIDVNVESGTFTSGFYIINIFLMPAFLLGYYHLMGKKEQKRKYLVFIILACLISMLCGNPLPLEICMLVLSPLLYITYLVLCGFGFAATTALSALVGFNFDGILFTALPGNIVDLVTYLSNYKLYEAVLFISLIGIVMGLIFYAATIAYFKYFAIGLLSMHDADIMSAYVIEAMGGIENIVSIDATPDKINASFKNRDIVDLDALHQYGAYLILESRDGYTIRLGNISIMICERINQQVQDIQLGNTTEEA